MDTQLFFIINGHHTYFLDAFFYLVSLKSVWLPLYIALAYAVWRNYSWRGVFTMLLMIGAGMLFTDFANAQFLRPLIGRLRPSNPENPIAPFVHIVNGRFGYGSGFPSAHASNIWLLTFITAHWLRDRLIYVTMAVIAVTVCYSRIYLGFHYPGDILGGLILASFVALPLTHLNKRYLRFRSVPNPRHTWATATVASLTILSFIAVAFYASGLMVLTV